MELLPNEKVIAKHEYTVLTNNSVIQEKESLFDNLNYIEIPIEKIDSISRNHVFKSIYLAFFSIFLILGTYFYIQNQDVENSFISLIISLISFALYIFTSKKELIIRAGNQIILEDARGANKFVSELRHHVHKHKMH